MTGITSIEYQVRDKTYDRYVVVINGKTIYIPVIGNMIADNEVRTCQMLNDLIKGHSR